MGIRHRPGLHSPHGDGAFAAQLASPQPPMHDGSRSVEEVVPTPTMQRRRRLELSAVLVLTALLVISVLVRWGGAGSSSNVGFSSTHKVRPALLTRAPSPTATSSTPDSSPAPTGTQLSPEATPLSIDEAAQLFRYDTFRRRAGQLLYLSDACVTVQQLSLSLALRDDALGEAGRSLLPLIPQDATRLMLVQPHPLLVATVASVAVDEVVVTGPLSMTAAAVMDNHRECVRRARSAIANVRAPDAVPLFADAANVDGEFRTRLQWMRHRLKYAAFEQSVYGGSGYSEKGFEQIVGDADADDSGAAPLPPSKLRLAPGSFRYSAPPRQYVTVPKNYTLAPGGHAPAELIRAHMEGAGGLGDPAAVVRRLQEPLRRTLMNTVHGGVNDSVIRVEAVEMEAARRGYRRKVAASGEGHGDDGNRNASGWDAVLATNGRVATLAKALRSNAMGPNARTVPGATFDVAVICPLPSRDTWRDQIKERGLRDSAASYADYLAWELLRAGDRTHGRVVVCLAGLPGSESVTGSASMADEDAKSDAQRGSKRSTKRGLQQQHRNSGDRVRPGNPQDRAQKTKRGQRTAARGSTAAAIRAAVASFLRAEFSDHGGLSPRQAGALRRFVVVNTPCTDQHDCEFVADAFAGSPAQAPNVAAIAQLGPAHSLRALLEGRRDMFPGLLVFESVVVVDVDTAEAESGRSRPPAQPFDAARDAFSPDMQRYFRIQAATRFPNVRPHDRRHQHRRETVPRAVQVANERAAFVGKERLAGLFAAAALVPEAERERAAAHTGVGTATTRLTSSVADSSVVATAPRSVYRFRSYAEHFASAFHDSRVTPANPLGLLRSVHFASDASPEPVLVHSAANTAVAAVMRGDVSLAAPALTLSRLALQPAMASPRVGAEVPRVAGTDAASLFSTSHGIKDPSRVSLHAPAFNPGTRDESDTHGGKLGRAKAQRSGGTAAIDARRAAFDLDPPHADRFDYTPALRRRFVPLDKTGERRLFDPRLLHGNLLPAELRRSADEAEEQQHSTHPLHGSPEDGDGDDAGGHGSNTDNRRPADAGGRRAAQEAVDNATVAPGDLASENDPAAVKHEYRRLARSMCNAAMFTLLRRCQTCIGSRRSLRTSHPFLQGLDGAPFGVGSAPSKQLGRFEQVALGSTRGSVAGGIGEGERRRNARDEDEVAAAEDQRKARLRGNYGFDGARGDSNVANAAEEARIMKDMSSPFCEEEVRRAASSAAEEASSAGVEAFGSAMLIAASAVVPLAFSLGDDVLSATSATESAVTEALRAHVQPGLQVVPPAASFFVGLLQENQTRVAIDGRPNRAGGTSVPPRKPTAADFSEALPGADASVHRDAVKAWENALRGTDASVMHLDAALRTVVKGRGRPPFVPAVATAALIDTILMIAMDAAPMPAKGTTKSGASAARGSAPPPKPWLMLGSCLPSFVPAMLHRNGRQDDEGAALPSFLTAQTAVQSGVKSLPGDIDASARGFPRSMQLVNDADCAEVDDVVTRFTDGARLMPRLGRPRFEWSRINSDATGGADTAVTHEWVKRVHDEHISSGDGHGDNDNDAGCATCHRHSDGGGRTDPTRIAPPFAPLDASRQQTGGDGASAALSPGHLTASQARITPTGAEDGSSMLIVDALHFLEVYADARVAAAASGRAEPWLDPVRDWPSPHDDLDSHVGAVLGESLDAHADMPSDARVGWREWQWRLFSSVTVVGAVDGSGEVHAAGMESFLLRFARDVCPDATNGTACAVEVEPLMHRARSMATRYGQGTLDDPHVKAYATALARSLLRLRGYVESRTVLTPGGSVKAIIFTKMDRVN